MSQRTLPLLFFNLGGEMLYILHQRLHAQNVVTGKTARVMQDMVKTMFREQSLEELFKPQPIPSRKGLQMLLQGVAHSSIMRLSNTAMDKLYDLISMAFKYQLMVCPRPEDIVLVTLNHLDSIKSLVADDSQHCHDMIHTACRKLNEHYSLLSKAEFVTLRNTMLSLFQDSQKRISVLMRQKLQHQNGAFVIPIDGPIPVGFEIPGTIRYYSEEGEVVQTDHFPTAHHYTPPCKQGSWETTGDRVTTLGLNIYEKDSPGARPRQQRSVSEERCGRTRGTGGSSRMKETREDTQEDVSTAVGNVELTLLHRLLVSPQTDKETTFKLNLFPDLKLDGGGTGSPGDESASGRETSERNRGNVLHLETNKKGTEDLNRIREDFTTADTEQHAADEEDLLDLLDQATA
ncbi:Protein OSCP1 [Geodia barretti]|uniref:Protein OSCP1 n=1 Tax=Geodia barretti TaxID=519541 RepID=A0AA35S2K2_GEOBA|nr:Protein OSCP1 [Geodia barretti]